MALAPLSRIVIVTESGVARRPTEMVVIPPRIIATLANTPIGSTLPIAALPGAVAAFAALSDTSTDIQADIDQLDRRFDQLEA